MASLIIPKRSSTNILSDEQLKCFYHKILLFTESDRTFYGEAKALKSVAASNTKLSSFDFVYVNYEIEMQNPQIDHFYFCADIQNQKSTTIRYTCIVKKWFKHIRNAFAHNYITFENGLYVLKDYSKDEKTGKIRQTLFVQLSSFENFETLIDDIKASIIMQEQQKHKNP